MSIEDNKNYAIKKLEKGIADDCADDIAEVLVNLEDGTCDYLELIPVLKRIAGKKTFYYFDDNGAGGFPRADLNREASFAYSASKAIENIIKNAGFISNSVNAVALKSNSTYLIKKTLENLQSEGSCADNSLIPILEKIVRKDVYQSYSYNNGLETDCHLRELAQSVIQIILRNYEQREPIKKQQQPEKVESREQSEEFEECAFCETLPAELTVNTGRDYKFPEAFYKLTVIDESKLDEQFRRCPECRAYFKWTNLSERYGSGNGDEEQLIRLPTKISRLLGKLFSANPQDYPQQKDVKVYFETIPGDLLLEEFRLVKSPDIIAPFVPRLVWLLRLNAGNSAVTDVLANYVSDNRERAEELLKELEKFPLANFLRYCLDVTKKD
jgi:hypothetical protein